MVRISIIVVFLLGTLFVTQAQYVDIQELLKDEATFLEWDGMGETGHLIRKETTIIFKINTPFLLVDFQRKITIDPPILKKGQLLLPAATAQRMIEIFSEAEELALSRKKVAVIILDAGHGGKDPGSVAYHELEKGKLTIFEKDIALKVTLLLEAKLKAQYLDKKIVLTRNDDRFLKLEERPEIANNIAVKDNDAILFISIHTNSGFNKKTQGYEVWHLPPTYKRELISANDITTNDKAIIPILNSMLQEEYLVESIKLARDILNQLDKEVGDVTLNRGLKEEAWFVVKKANMPSILIELGFLSNKEEAIRLSTDSYLNKLVAGIYNGIADFIARFESTKGLID